MSNICMLSALLDLKMKNVDALKIYYLEDMTNPTDEWAVDVMQDDLNDACKLNWTWEVFNIDYLKFMLKEDPILCCSYYEIIVDAPFSDEVVCESVRNWLMNKGFDFEVEMIEPKDARGSGIYKDLIERMKHD